MKKWLELFRFMRDELNAREKIRFAYVLIVTVASSVLTAISPVILSALTDQLVALPTIKAAFPISILALTVAYLACIGINRLSSTISMYLQSMLRIGVVTLLSTKYFLYLYRQDASFFSHRNSGELSHEINQANNDFYLVIRNFVFNVASPLIQLFSAFFVLVHSGSSIIALAFLVYALLFILNNVLQTKKLTALKNDVMEAGRRSYSTLVDSIVNLSVIRQYGTHAYLASRYRNVLDADKKVQLRYWGTNITMLAVNAVLFVGLFSFSFLWVLRGVLDGHVSPGHFVMVASYIIMLTAPIESLGNVFSEINQSLFTLSGFVRKIKIASPLDKKVDVLNRCSPIIEIHNISLSYPGQNTAALKAVSMDIEAGQKIVWTGESGAGKSSLIKILTGQYRPDSGCVKIFGKNIMDVTQASLCSIVGLVAQDALIFKDTLRFNMLVANPDASDEEVNGALRKAGLASFLDQLPDGLDAMLGDRGATLSGGQKQRISLARVFLRKPEILIVDEGTSSLDVLTERTVIENIMEVFGEKTIIMVCHRASAMSFADRIFVFHQGEIVDQGSKERLYTNNRYFADIVNLSALDL